MKSSKEYAEIYKDLVQIYKEEIETSKYTKNYCNPDKTVQKMLEKHDLDDIKMAFGIVGHIKVDLFHDGRIWGSNKGWIKEIPFPEDCKVWNHDNPFCNGTMDEIHTAHIDNLLTAIRKAEKALNTKDKYEVSFGPNTKQFWVYNSATNLMIDIPTDVLNTMEEIVRANGSDADAYTKAEDWLSVQINGDNPPEWLNDADYMYDGDLEI